MAAAKVQRRCGWPPWRVTVAEVEDLPCFYSLLCFFRIWAISSDVPFGFSMEETILPSLPWFLVFVSALLLIVFFAFVLLLWCIILFCLRHLLSLLATPLLLYVENLLIRRLLRLWLALAFVAPLSIPVISLVLLVLILFFQPSSKVIVWPAVLLKLSV